MEKAYSAEARGKVVSSAISISIFLLFADMYYKVVSMSALVSVPAIGVFAWQTNANICDLLRPLFPPRSRHSHRLVTPRRPVQGSPPDRLHPLPPGIMKGNLWIWHWK